MAAWPGVRVSTVGFETEKLDTGRLFLEPLRVEHAGAMLAVLEDSCLYEFTGGKPPTSEELVERYQHQIAGPDRPNEHWHNWIVRRVDTSDVIGFIQATVVDDSADLAWLVGMGHQGHGFAGEAAQAILGWLQHHGIARFSAHIHPTHQASGRVAAAIGLSRTEAEDDEGEEIWVTR
jgi:RimJ/RimL family protein N-acetyltransferase